MGNESSKAGSGFIFGLALIILGLLLFLNNLRIVSLNVAEMFWPVILAIGGIGGLTKARKAPDVVWPATLLAASVILFLSTMRWIPYIGLFSLWPLALIAGGVTTILSGSRFKQLATRLAPSNWAPGSSETWLHEVSIFSAVKRQVYTPAFEGGDLSSIFGGIEVDFRRAGLANGKAVVEANSVFGGIELRVPETWKVIVEGFAVFGGYEDKSLPPRPEPGLDAPMLIVRGNTAFGGVVIKN